MSKRTAGQDERAKGFEKQTNKSAFSPGLTTKATLIAMWVENGKNFDQILQGLPGIQREELQKYLASKGLAIKSIKSKRASFGGE